MAGIWCANRAAGAWKMPNLPVTASSRELQRPRPIPRRVRDVITLMVYGRIDDESGLTMQSAFILALRDLI
jgi:hypothetical protein